jgi:hypothetical protein
MANLMPLTHEEREFLDAYVFEATNGPPFGGPATRILSQNGIHYIDLSWILTAYQRELSAEGKPAAGILNPEPRPSPWEILCRVKERNRVLKMELATAASDRPVRNLFDFEQSSELQ